MQSSLVLSNIKAYGKVRHAYHYQKKDSGCPQRSLPGNMYLGKLATVQGLVLKLLLCTLTGHWLSKAESH